MSHSSQMSDQTAAIASASTRKEIMIVHPPRTLRKPPQRATSDIVDTFFRQEFSKLRSFEMDRCQSFDELVVQPSATQDLEIESPVPGHVSDSCKQDSASLSPKNKSEDWFCDDAKSKDQSRRDSTYSSNGNLEFLNMRDGCVNFEKEFLLYTDAAYLLFQS
eukprot:2908428-Rhodomonas_salina.1